MQPTIKTLPETKLIGMRRTMSFANNQTQALWQGFMPRRKEIVNAIGSDLYSLEVYKDTQFFKNFNPEAEFEKWAAVAVSSHDNMPESMEALTVPAGDYAVFPYKGKGSDAAEFYRYIFTTWLPQSEYELDDRPHFALMGDKYKREDPESEEEIWIPVRQK